MKTIFYLLGFLLVISCQAREWTALDGRKLQADFVSATATQVTLKRSTDGQVFPLEISRLSVADQNWIKEHSSATTPSPVASTGSGMHLSGPFSALATGDWALSKHGNLPFAFYASKDLDAAKSYPLILALHGRSQNDENGKQVGGWMKSFTKEERYKRHPCIIVAPLGYQPFGGTGSAWNSVPGQESMALVIELIKSLPIDKERVFCVGYSMGGFGTCHLIHSQPRLFAAGVAVAGCTGPDTADTFKKVPLWLFHAADDATVPVTSSQELWAELKRNKECQYTEYPTGGHGIVGKVFEEESLHEWLFSKGINK